VTFIREWTEGQLIWNRYAAWVRGCLLSQPYYTAFSGAENHRRRKVQYNYVTYD